MELSLKYIEVTKTKLGKPQANGNDTGLSYPYDEPGNRDSPDRLYVVVLMDSILCCFTGILSPSWGITTGEERLASVMIDGAFRYLFPSTGLILKILP